jgi:hypothetical protein
MNNRSRFRFDKLVLQKSHNERLMAEGVDREKEYKPIMDNLYKLFVVSLDKKREIRSLNV